MLHTNVDYAYGSFILSPSKTYMTFKVRACNDAHIALAADDSMDPANSYEIVISGWFNQRSVIRPCHQCQEWISADTPDLLSCDTYRQFWISWDNLVLSVGSGWQVGTQAFLTYSIDEQQYIPIYYASVSTGWESDGDWLLPTAVGKLKCFTASSCYRHIQWHSEHALKAEFKQVHGVSFAQSLLSGVTDLEGKQTYVIALDRVYILCNVSDILRHLWFAVTQATMSHYALMTVSAAKLFTILQRSWSVDIATCCSTLQPASQPT